MMYKQATLTVYRGELLSEIEENIHKLLNDGYILINQIKLGSDVILIFGKPNLQEVASSSWFTPLKTILGVLLETVTRGRIKI